MRIVRLFGAVLTILTAGLLLATPVGAQPPAKLTDHVTDTNGVLTDSGRAAVNSAIDRLYRDQHIQLWVVYVDNYNRFKPDNWVEQTRSASGMGDHDALLAVATNTRLYALSVPGFRADELNSLQSNKIEPAVRGKDWSGAAVAAADGLNKPVASNDSANSSKRTWLFIAIGVAVAVVLLVLIIVLYRARRRRRVGSGGGQANGAGGDHSPAHALPTAEARLRQITDYVAKHSESIGSEAKTRLAEAKRHLDAAHDKEPHNHQDAVAHARAASALAAQAQTLANSDVIAAHRSPRRRGATAK